ncbi:MAG: hypothetical protein Q4F97_12515 [Bacteroidales bacterium]|nr:hypothetical protein [Bacteroidales bacterium]
MKKEKITRATLDELEKTMPVLSENEQRNCTGGYRYYDESGMFIEKIGDENEIRIINRTNYNNIKPESGNFGIRDMEILESFSTSLSSVCSLNVKEAVIRSIAKELSVNDLNFINNPSSSGGTFNPDTGIITFNLSNGSVQRNNYFEIFLIILHEKQHKDTPDDSGSIESEIDAYKAMINHSYFSNTSTVFQNTINNYLKELESKKNS